MTELHSILISAAGVLDILAAKVPEKEIIEDHAYLEVEDIAACLKYAAAEADHPVLISR